VVMENRRDVQDRIETERLILRPFEASDAGAAFGWAIHPNRARQERQGDRGTI